MSLISLARVSKTWNKPASRILYRKIDINFSVTEVIWTSRLLSVLLDRNTGKQYQDYVRHLIVTAADFPEEKKHLNVCLPLISNVIRCLSKLQSFSWHVPQNISISILHALKASVNAQILDLQHYNCNHIDLDKKILGTLKRDTRVKASLLELSDDNLQDDSGRLHPLSIALRRAVLQAPQLQTLVIRVSLTPRAISQWRNRTLPHLDWSQEDRDILGSVENLRIIGSAFKLLQGIVGAFQTTNLRILELLNCGYCRKLLEGLTEASGLQLRVFKIIGNSEVDDEPWLSTADGTEVCKAFLLSFEGLEELELGWYQGTDMACVTWHHRTLRKLTWYENGISSSVKANALAQIRDGCSQLRSLRMNEPLERLHTVSIRS